MSYVVNNRSVLENQGLDPEGTEVMFAITPNYVAEVYNRCHNGVQEDHPDFQDLWGQLSQESRNLRISAVQRLIDRHFASTDEVIQDWLEMAESAAPEAPHA